MNAIHEQPKILIISYTDINTDPRVLRQVNYLSAYYDITVAGLQPPSTRNGNSFIKIRRQEKRSMGEAARALSLLLGVNGLARRRFYHDEGSSIPPVSLVICNDAEPLPMAFEFAKGAPVLFDAHEYYPLEFESSLKWRLFMQRNLTALCREYVPRCAAMTTVSMGIADKYAEVFGVRPEVIHSGPEFHSLQPTDVSEECVRLVHHGTANKDRGLECMIETVRLLDNRFTLDFYLVGSQRVIAELKKLSEDVPQIRWRQPLPMQELSRKLNSYDMGFYMLKANGFNNTYALPNKFFEFIQARLAIAVGPSPTMAQLVKEHKLGTVSDDFTPHTMAARLNALTREDVQTFKQNSHAAANIFTAENEMQKLHALVKKVLDK